MRVFRSVSKFYNGDSGSIAIFLVLILPLLIVLGGIATDITLLNAQKKHVQARADLAAMSGIAFLEAPDRMLEVIRDIDAANDRNNGRAIVKEDVVLGRFSKASGFTALEDLPEGTAPNAIEVSVTSPFRPMLLSAVLSDENLNITRRAVSTRSGNIIFSLRNSLLRLDTSKSVLAPLLQDTLGVQLSVLDSTGLLTSKISLRELLGTIPVPLGIDVNALTFRELLAIPVDTRRLLSGLFKGNVGGESHTLKLGDIMSASGDLLDIRLRDMPPDLNLNVLDMVTAVVEFVSQDRKRDRVVRAFIDNDVLGLIKKSVDVGVVSGPVWAAGSTEDNLSATVEQIAAKISADVTNVLTIDLDVTVGGAVAVLEDVTCVPATSNDEVASFTAQTFPVSLGLGIKLLNTTLISQPQYDKRGFGSTPIGGGEDLIPVSVRASQIGQPVDIVNEITLSSILISPIRSIVEGIGAQLSTDKAKCSDPVTCLLTGLIKSLADVLNGTLGLVTRALTTTLGLVDDLLKPLTGGRTKLNNALDILLRELGIAEAQAELIVHSISCGAPKLVR